MSQEQQVQKVLKFNVPEGSQKPGSKQFSEDKPGLSKVQLQAQKDQVMMTSITTKGGIRNKKVITLLEKQVYPEVRAGLSMIEKKNSSARRAAIKLEKMKRRLEMGSDFDEDSAGEHYHPTAIHSPTRKYRGGGAVSPTPNRQYQSTLEDHDDGGRDDEDESIDEFDSDEDYTEDENMSPSNDNRGDDDERQIHEIFNPFMEFADVLRKIKTQRQQK
ncbi:UNKNOWN [Stylonychia lemnae]|uniref:Uncharacterized protein n=1 Tax=Stylonychia lemnae TaxID=5949 RepID=A0A078B399_STYLE|nr:UNKNOWN [Stylonychia lemnae]|eukprot:CDW88909.1 UNKNOWN [Stylonychia lemnae]